MNEDEYAEWEDKNYPMAKYDRGRYMNLYAKAEIAAKSISEGKDSFMLLYGCLSEFETETHLLFVGLVQNEEGKKIYGQFVNHIQKFELWIADKKKDKYKKEIILAWQCWKQIMPIIMRWDNATKQ